MIRVENLTKNYGQGVQIGPVNVEISSGLTALVGPNGAGKSTLLTMIGRLLEADSGTVTIDGRDIASMPSREVSTMLAILRQDNHFVTRLTVRQLVAFGRFPYSRGRLTVKDERIVSEAIDFVNLTPLENRFLDELSGGQRQRAYVAMVLAQDTEYLLLDEPLNNLDMQHSVQMMKQLRRASDELGRTVVIVVHDINFAAHYADHIIAMNDGKVTVQGSPTEIVCGETLSRVFKTVVDVVDGPRGPLAVYF